jgi:DNA-binding transcriptional LysR family regulator
LRLSASRRILITSAHLTEAGRVLLADAEPHLAGFHQFKQLARLMASGGASEVRLSVDSLVPGNRLFVTLAWRVLGQRGGVISQPEESSPLPRSACEGRDRST